MTQREIACASCRRFWADYRAEDVCDAFPRGIPREILMGDNDHRKGFKGDRGLGYRAGAPHRGTPDWVTREQAEQAKEAEAAGGG